MAKSNKDNQNKVIGILQKLYLYSYRFFLPTYFLTYQKDFELQIKLHFIQTYGSQSLKKNFLCSQNNAAL